MDYLCCAQLRPRPCSPGAVLAFSTCRRHHTLQRPGYSEQRKHFGFPFSSPSLFFCFSRLRSWFLFQGVRCLSLDEGQPQRNLGDKSNENRVQVLVQFLKQPEERERRRYLKMRPVLRAQRLEAQSLTCPPCRRLHGIVKNNPVSSARNTTIRPKAEARTKGYGGDLWHLCGGQRGVNK